MILHLSKIKLFRATRLFVRTAMEGLTGQEGLFSSLDNLMDMYAWISTKEYVWNPTNQAYKLTEIRSLTFAEKAEKWFSILMLTIPCIVELALYFTFDIVLGALDIARAAALDIFDAAVWSVAKLVKLAAWTIDKIIISPIAYLAKKLGLSEDSDDDAPDAGPDALPQIRKVAEAREQLAATIPDREFIKEDNEKEEGEIEELGNTANSDLPSASRGNTQPEATAYTSVTPHEHDDEDDIPPPSQPSKFKNMITWMFSRGTNKTKNPTPSVTELPLGNGFTTNSVKLESAADKKLKA